MRIFYIKCEWRVLLCCNVSAGVLLGWRCFWAADDSSCPTVDCPVPAAGKELDWRKQTPSSKPNFIPLKLFPPEGPRSNWSTCSAQQPIQANPPNPLSWPSLGLVSRSSFELVGWWSCLPANPYPGLLLFAVHHQPCLGRQPYCSTWFMGPLAFLNN